MAKAWARQEAKTNEIAAILEKGVLWVKFHPQAALWGGIGTLAAVIAIAAFVNRTINEREESWSRFAFAQSYAYSKQPVQALEQVQSLSRDYPASAATSYGLLLAGDILFEQGKFKEAIATYNQVVSRPNHRETLPLALANLGISQEASGDCQSATGTDQRFLDAYPEHFLAPQVHASLARCLSLTGDTEKAKATYERIAFLYPDTYWATWASARIKGS